MGNRFQIQILIASAMTLGAPWSIALGSGGNGGTGDGYPESRFGQPPSRSALGLDAIRPGEEADAWDSLPKASRHSANREPAGLVFGKDRKSGVYGEGEDNAQPATSESTARPSAELRSETPSTVASGEDSHSTELSAMAARHKGVQEVALIAGDLGFFPKTVFVARDVPVRLFVTGASKNTLCIMMDSFQVRKQVRSQHIEEITFTPNEPGSYRFYCPVNGMEGTLVVKEFSSGV